MSQQVRWVALTLILLVALTSFSPLQAQFDPGEYNIIQDGRLVGTLFVPERSPAECVYWEHWFVFDTYRYPGSEDGLETIFEATDEAPAETLQRIRAGEGHWISVQAFEERPECRP